MLAVIAITVLQLREVKYLAQFGGRTRTITLVFLTPNPILLIILLLCFKLSEPPFLHL